MKRGFILLQIFFALFYSSTANSQGFNEEKTTIANFVKRMYKNSPFEGVKVIDDYDHQFFISVISLEKVKYPSSSTMNRVAQVKAQQQANIFFNGSTISSDLVIKTTETKDNTSTKSTVEMIESIRENSAGFVQGMELLINFDIEEGKRMVFIYYREMNEEKK